MGHGRAGPRQQFDFVVRQVHGVGHGGAGGEQAKAVAVGHGALSEHLLALGGFRGGFRQVDVQGQVQFLGQRLAALQQLRRGGVHRVRGDALADARVVPPALVQLPHQRKARVGVGVGGRGKAEDALAAQAAHARLVHGAVGGVLDQVHVVEGGGAGAQHFGAAQQGPGLHDVGREVLFHGKDVLRQPFHQRQVVGHAPQKGHGRVGVRVDQAGQDQRIAKVQHPRWRVRGSHGLARAHVQHHAVGHGQCPVFDDGSQPVLCNDAGGLYEDVAGACHGDSFGWRSAAGGSAPVRARMMPTAFGRAAKRFSFNIGHGARQACGMRQ